MRKIPLLLYTAIFLVMLALPVLDSRLHIFKRTEIIGQSNHVALPEFSKSEFRKGLYQKTIERALLQNNALWGWGVRAANQLTASLFHQVSLSDSTSVQLGNEGYFFQPMYFKAFNREKSPPVKLIRTQLAKTKKLIDLLAARGTPAVLLLSPNLVALYPELMPERYTDPLRLDRSSSYAVAKESIEKLGIPTVDAFKLLQDKVPTQPFRFFEPTGSHWNELAACLTAEAVVNSLNSRDPKLPFQRPNCSNYSMQFPPPEADIDLLNIANLLFPKQYLRPAPVIHPQPVSEAKHKNILLVGTSFLFALEQQLLRHKVTATTDLLFYFREHRSNGIAKSGRAIDQTKVDWKRILDTDAIVLEVNQSGPGQVGFRFVEGALNYLDPKPIKKAKKRR